MKRVENTESRKKEQKEKTSQYNLIKDITWRNQSAVKTTWTKTKKQF